MDFNNTIKQQMAYPKTEIVKISEIPSVYPKEWVTVDITQRDDNGWPFEGKVILHSKNKRDLIAKLDNLNDGDFYLFYSGSIDDDVSDEEKLRCTFVG